MAGTDLVSLSDYKNYKGINSTTEDIIISSIIPAVSTFIKSYCGRTFIDYYSVDNTEYFSSGGTILQVKEYPIKEIVSVEYSVDYGATYTALVENTDYYVNLETGQFFAVNGFTEGFNAIKIVYKGGYNTTPEDIKLATLDLIDYYKNEDYRPKKTEGRSSVENSSNRQITVTNLPIHIKRALDMYREV